MKIIGRILTLIGIALLFGCSNPASNDQPNSDQQTAVPGKEGSETKKSFNETVKVLKELGVISKSEHPEKPDTMPQYDDENPTGISIFRTGLENKDMSNLDMQRTFFLRSEIKDCSFKYTYLSGSNLCWNDFIKVDFSGADLSNADLRASIYDSVYFTGTNLAGADLRRSSFEECDFTLANMSGTKLTHDIAEGLNLSAEQIRQIDWQKNDGEEPLGG
ncbi:pentapeptide repeat-containing protein [Fulvivirga sp. M361]|uniref:pentapeptide repeat-containing protein n=1 Tax=Fulvivirga sp. M361 TaxID=2594266 RepID=UPI00117AB981|nr:pentapeptide repeat-containing protein [Fulvivirga sp. M361]TRX57680.1 pentapeptide repeat-containing protein [Fulvivirga sp. M361]